MDPFSSKQNFDETYYTIFARSANWHIPENHTWWGYIFLKKNLMRLYISQKNMRTIIEYEIFSKSFNEIDKWIWIIFQIVWWGG